MAIRADLYTCLTAASAVTAICGTRIYPVRAPQDFAVPCVVSQEITSVAAETHDDAQHLDESLYQFTCLAGTLAEARNLRNAVRAALLANGAISGVKVVRPVTSENYEEEAEMYRADLELTFFHNPSV